MTHLEALGGERSNPPTPQTFEGRRVSLLVMLGADVLMSVVLQMRKKKESHSSFFYICVVLRVFDKRTTE